MTCISTKVADPLELLFGQLIATRSNLCLNCLSIGIKLNVCCQYASYSQYGICFLYNQGSICFFILPSILDGNKVVRRDLLAKHSLKFNIVRKNVTLSTPVNQNGSDTILSICIDAV